MEDYEHILKRRELTRSMTSCSLMLAFKQVIPRYYFMFVSNYVLSVRLQGYHSYCTWQYWLPQ